MADALSHLELESDDIDKLYETLESMGVEVETEGVLEKALGDGDDDSFEPDTVEEVPEEELIDTSAMAETFAIDDPVRMYLKEIGKVDLLTPEEEVTLAERMQKGSAAAERIAAEGDAIPPEERAQLDKDIKAGDRAKKRLAEANLRLVVSIAKRYVGRGMLFLDLIQEGNLGLIKAVEKFDSTKGLQVLDLRDLVDPSGHHPRDRGSGAHHPHPGTHGRDHQQGHSCFPSAASGARP